MSTPEHHFFSHTEGRGSADLESCVQPELVKQGTDQPSPEPSHGGHLQMLSPGDVAIRTCTKVLALPLNSALS